MVIKKSVHQRPPPIHPGMQQRLIEAEAAEARGETPKRAVDGAQKIIRPSLDTYNEARIRQAETIGLIEPAYRSGIDGREALADQPAFRPGEDLDAIWDELGEADKIKAGATERFRLEMEASLRRAAMPHELPHKIGGRLDARNLRRTLDNIRTELDALTYLLAPDSRELLDRFALETRELVELCLKQRAIQGLDALAMDDMLRDLVHKLVYQELSSRRRAMGDRGIRRICANIDLSERLYAGMKRLGISPRERLLMRIVHVHQDLGHTAYAARVSYRGGRLHRAYSARIFTDEMNRYRQIVPPEELELVRTAVATHSSEELPFSTARLLAIIRCVDHLAPFAPHRVYKHLEALPHIHDYLDDLRARALASDVERYLAVKFALRDYLNEQDLAAPLCDDIMASLRCFERQADWVELGALAGVVNELTIDPSGTGRVTATLEEDAFAAKYQGLFDVQQDQLARVARNTGVGLEALQNETELHFGKPELGVLVVRR